MTEATMPDPGSMKGVIPYLVLGGRAGEACDFYAKAFGATEMGRMPFPDGTPGLMHAQVGINEGCLMMTDYVSESAAPGSPAGHLQLVVGDGRAWWDRAVVAAGCTVLAPYERQPWGDDWGLLADPFGIKWAVLEPGSQA